MTAGDAKAWTLWSEVAAAAGKGWQGVQTLRDLQTCRVSAVGGVWFCGAQTGQQAVVFCFAVGVCRQD
jgi:hypothetical protein